MALTCEDKQRLVEFYQEDGHPTNWLLFEQKWPEIQSEYPEMASGIAQFVAGQRKMDAGFEALAKEIGVSLNEDGGGLT